MMSVDHSIMIKLLMGDSICGLFVSHSLWLAVWVIMNEIGSQLSFFYA
jgi:hypothetical protein